MIRVICSYYRKIREWGLGGVVTFVKNHIRDFRFRKVLLQNARKYPMSPIRGVTVMADLSSNTSLSKTNRDFCFALKAAGIPYQTFDLNTGNSIYHEDVDDILTPRDDFRIMKYTDVVEMLLSPFPDELPLRKSTIAFWEFESGFLDAYPFMWTKKCVIGMSDFNVTHFRNVLPHSAEVFKILYPFRVPAISPLPVDETRARYGLRTDDFIVFFNFDYASSYGRKNPDGCLRAFAKALSDKTNAKLVFKTMRAKSHPDDVAKLMALADDLGVRDRVVSIDDYLPDADIVSLTNACDVYMSLHRGEGFGLGIAEAMSLGKPVVVTDWSSTTEFCKPDCSMPVSYKIVKTPKDKIDHPYYATLKEWAEPDIDDAARSLKKLYDNPVLRQNLGHKARESIRVQFSIENFRDSVLKFLEGHA